MKDLRIAAVTCRAPVGDIEGNIEQTIHWTHKAHEAGAELVCFPELNLTGYSTHADMANIALQTNSPHIERLADLSKQLQTIILAGMAERNPHGLPFASHIVLQPDRKAAVYRKLHLAPNEKPYFSAGDEVPVFKTPKANIGIQLCYDGHFPELSTSMTQKDAHIIFMPHASPRGDAPTKHQSWMRHLPARAYDNGVFIVACNQWGTNKKGLTFPGNAMVIGPSGNIIAKRLDEDEGFLMVDLKSSDWQAVRSHPMRHFFPNRRSDLYSI